MSQPFQSTDKVELVTTCQSLTWACFLLLLFHAMTMRSLISSRTLWWTWGVCQLVRYEKSQMESVSVTSTLDGNRAFFQGDEASRLREDLALLKELPLMFSQSHDVPEQDVHSTSCTNSQPQNSRIFTDKVVFVGQQDVKPLPRETLAWGTQLTPIRKHRSCAYRDMRMAGDGSGAKVFFTFVLSYVFHASWSQMSKPLWHVEKSNGWKQRKKINKINKRFSKRKPQFWHVQKRGRDGRAPFLSWNSTSVEGGLHESLRPHLYDATASPQCPCVGELTVRQSCREFSSWPTAKSNSIDGWWWVQVQMSLEGMITNLMLYIWKLASK